MTETKIPPAIRALLACPKCHGPLVDDVADDQIRLACGHCRVAYPVREGIPVMLLDEASSIVP